MRVTYSREQKVKTELAYWGIENLISMTYELMDEVELEGIAGVIIIFVPAGLLKEIEGLTRSC